MEDYRPSSAKMEPTKEQALLGRIQIAKTYVKYTKEHNKRSMSKNSSPRKSQLGSRKHSLTNASSFDGEETKSNAISIRVLN